MKKQILVGYIGTLSYNMMPQLKFAQMFEMKKYQLEKLIGKEETDKKILDWWEEAYGQCRANFTFVINKIDQEIFNIDKNG